MAGLVVKTIFAAYWTALEPAYADATTMSAKEATWPPSPPSY